MGYGFVREGRDCFSQVDIFPFNPLIVSDKRQSALLSSIAEYISRHSEFQKASAQGALNINVIFQS